LGGEWTSPPFSEMVRGNDITKPIHFSASLIHNKQTKKEIWQTMTFPPPQPGGTFTDLLAFEGDRNKKL